MPTIHLLIKGKVQGVFYRVNAKKTADSHGLTGWVKNTSEGFVEAAATGSTDKLNEFIKWCKKGPAFAEVSEINITDLPETGFNEFKIISKD